MQFRLLPTCLATACTLLGVSLPAGASTAVKPYALMRTVVADADAERSVRVTTTAKMSGLKIMQVTDAGRDAGRQSITLTKLGYSNTVKVIFIEGLLFVKGDSSILISYLGLSQANANELAGQWFGIPKSSGYYAQVAAGLTISTGMSEVTMTSSVTSSPAAKLNGALVDVLKGTSVRTSLQPSFKETLYVSTAKKPLPVEVTQNVQGSIGTVLFGHWNETLVVTAPKITQHLN